tara:strand:+ start:1852 stop:5358 length:3507 start_codon:yes stop_codon:yes gene_type:complete
MNTRLVVYRPTLTNTGCVVNNPGSTYPVSDSETTITVDGENAISVGFVAYDTLVDNAGVEYGVIKQVNNSTTIVLYNVTTAIPDNAELFYKPEKPYDLDLQKAPNVRINYNWLDIREPDKKKSSFSQTIKIPFTNENNDFFENWFDVNLDTLIYNTRRKFKATVLVDSVPQLDGFIQLKAIYLNARVYEVIVFGDTANFFSDIKSKKLKDAFLDEGGNLDHQLDHFNTLANITNSWTSVGLTTLVSTTSNDVMYPIIDYGHTFAPLCDSMLWNPESLDPLGPFMGNDTVFADNANYYGLILSGNLKPAIRIQRLLKIIAEKAGYTITSNFLGLAQDGTQDKTTFFGRQFMTLAPQYEKVRTKIFNGFLATIGSPITDPNVSWDNFNCRVEGLIFDTESYDPNNLFNNSVVVEDVGITPNVSFAYDPENPSELPVGPLEIQINLNVTTPTVVTMDGSSVAVDNYYAGISLSSGAYMGIDEAAALPSGPNVDWSITFTIPASYIAEEIIQISFHAYPLGDGWLQDDDTWSVTINSGSIQTLNLGESLYINGGVNAEVHLYENMPDIMQSDFVKDLCSRYNLVVATNPDDSKNLIIEPYQDYISSGDIQYWTDKLDVSKEQVIKTTNELQKRNLLFTDLENKDYLNKSYTDKYTRVYGSLEQINTNDFAKGDFQNFSIYAPFIAQGVGHFDGNFQGMSPNDEIAIAYNFEVDDDGNRHPITDGKPMLFYYSGTPIDVTQLTDQFGVSFDFSIISGAYTVFSSTEKLSTGNTFPLCLQYDLSSLSSGITTSTKILHWEYYNPTFSTGFTFNVFGDTTTTHGYYQDYWAQYINEMYSDESRIMECYLDLNETDMFNFSFQNPVYIKNTLWRVLSVDNYVVGGKETTRVRLLKALSRLRYDCDYTFYQQYSSGYMTFTNIATGAVSFNVTEECCSGQNENWNWFSTGATPGLGFCMATLSAPLMVQQALPALNGGNGNPNQAISALPPLQIQSSLTQLNTIGNIITGQETSFFLECITKGSTTESLKQQNVNSSVIITPPNTMAYINVELAGSIIGGTNGFVGKVGFFEYYTVVTNIGGKKGYSGLAGGTKDKEIRDSDFAEPTVNITTYDDNNYCLKLSVTHSAGNTTKWFAKVKILLQPIGNPNSLIQVTEKAIYQNGTGILLQDYGFLLWN